MRLSSWLALVAIALPLQAGAELRYAEATSASSLNPFQVRDMPSLRAVELVYEGLVTPPEAGSVKPALARSWAVADDGLAVEFELQRGVTWHDGTPFTAADVAFTVAAGKDPRSVTTLRSQFEVFAGATAESPYRVRIRFARPVLNPLLYFDFKILPAHLFPEGFVGADADRSKVVGTGPYAFQEWCATGEIRFAANPAYYREGQPGIDRVAATVVPDDNIRNELLRYGAVDLVPQVRPRDIPALEELSGVRLYPYSTLSYSFIGVNFRNPVLRNPLVRRALARGLNRGEMLRAHYGNRGTVISGPFPPSSWAYNYDVKPWEYDATAAAALLAQAGAEDSDGDGVLALDGRPLSFRFVALARDEAQKAVVLDVQQQLKNLGIEVKVRFLEPMAWKKTVFEEHDFDLVLAEWTFDNSVNVFTLFHSTEAGVGMNNLGGYANPAVDRLLEESRAATDSEVLRTVYGELHRQLHGDLPYLFLWSLDRYAAVASRIDRVRLHPFYFFSYVGTWAER
jgi:peptide/nickel transport system substrate-binding protein